MMILEHAAIWAKDLEKVKDYYVKYFDAKASDKYVNEKKLFQSYFLSFDPNAFGSGTRLELMTMPGVPSNLNDTVNKQHLGLIHLAFGVASVEEVDHKYAQLKAAGFPILSGPRMTGDGYYEFETLDPENNRVEVTTVVSKEIK